MAVTQVASEPLIPVTLFKELVQLLNGGLTVICATCWEAFADAMLKNTIRTDFPGSGATSTTEYWKDDAQME